MGVFFFLAILVVVLVPFFSFPSLHRYIFGLPSFSSLQPVSWLVGWWKKMDKLRGFSYYRRWMYLSGSGLGLGLGLG